MADGESDGIGLRRATAADLVACAEIWREASNDYLGRLARPEIPPDNPALARLHAHTLETDPERFWVATRRDPAAGAGERAVGFASAVVRGGTWFLSMLFVRPEEQGAGIGRALLDRTLPPVGAGLVLATATDAVQPISNGLYASLGIVPRVPLLLLVGRPRDGASLPELPAGVRAARFGGAEPAERDHALEAELAALDLELLGFTHGQDHDFLRREGRTGFTYRDAADRLVGYGYTSEVGRIGPTAVRDQALQAAVVGHLLTAVEPRGASAGWFPGTADAALVTLLRAGLRVEGFPALLCWNRPFADLARYTPISPGLI